MLEYLSVKNIALIENAEIEFEKGLNALTGETGAGKSILLDSIGLLLGNRLDKSLIRKGEADCKVIGKFTIDKEVEQKFRQFCEKYDIDFCDEVLISRSYKIDGKSEIRLNGTMITLSMLKDFATFMVNSYGQHESFELFDTAKHLSILDNYSKISQFEPYEKYKSNYEKLLEINKKLAELGGDARERQNSIDLIKFQIEEIENFNISQDEYETLLDKRKLLLNLGKIISNTMTAQNLLDENLVSNILKAKSLISQASVYDESLADYSNRLDAVQIEIDDILDSIKSYNNNSNFDEGEEQQVEDRLSAYNKLFRKYGNTVDDILNFKDEISKKLYLLENADKEFETLSTEKQKILSNLFDYAKQISDYRKKYGKILCENITSNLKKLNINNANLNFNFEDTEFVEKNLTQNGIDRVELMFSANLGEELKPLNKIASGGEISRFMLALKAVIAESDNMPTMIFDEIDTGISGTTSEAIAKQMAIISKNHQIIVVTHSHQIASMADENYLIQKIEENDRTITKVKKLNSEEKINEIARFLSGENLTELSIQNAKHLIEEQDLYKRSL